MTLILALRVLSLRNAGKLQLTIRLIRKMQDELALGLLESSSVFTSGIFHLLSPLMQISALLLAAIKHPLMWQRERAYEHGIPRIQEVALLSHSHTTPILLTPYFLPLFLLYVFKWFNKLCDNSAHEPLFSVTLRTASCTSVYLEVTWKIIFYGAP